jgi:Zn finger protein HypA/HybF involved in hydrogenase expression
MEISIKFFEGENPEEVMKHIDAFVDMTHDIAQSSHGKWNINSDGYYPYCSCCKEEPPSGIMTKYCPNCGARMDLKE